MDRARDRGTHRSLLKSFVLLANNSLFIFKFLMLPKVLCRQYLRQIPSIPIHSETNEDRWTPMVRRQNIQNDQKKVANTSEGCMFMNSTNKTTTLYCYQEKLTSGETTNTHGIISTILLKLLPGFSKKSTQLKSMLPVRAGIQMKFAQGRYFP